MIKITEHLNGFTVEGHADHAEHGMDIVCAGVSSLAQAVARVLQSMFDAHVIIESGYVKVEHENYWFSESMNVSLVASVFWVGVQEIANQYPNHVQIERNPF